MPYLMGIDIGTTSARAIIIDESGKLVGAGVSEYPLYHPQPLFVEQEPLDWWEGTKKAIGEALKNANVQSHEIGGIGISGQMHSLVLLDNHCKVLRRSILWCDQRTVKQCEYIMRKTKQTLVQSTGNPALTGFTLPKIIWVMQEEPEIYEKVHKMLLPKDYIRFKLTGEFATEVSDASGTLMLDVKKRKWSEEILSAFRIKKENLPVVYESPQITGKITSESAKETGLKEGIPVVGGAGDQAAGGVGNGIIKEGLLSSTIGTSGVVFASLDDVKVDPFLRTHTFCHAIPGKWHIMGVMLCAGVSLKWFRDTFGMEEVNVGKMTGQDPYEILTMEASQVKPCSEGLIFLPYLMGERTPYPDPYAKGVFFGLTPRHTKAHLVRAVMEGVAFGLRDSLEIIKKLRIKIEEIRASGGGARSTLWRQIQADINNAPMSTISIKEGPAFGVALLAGVGTGIYKNVEEACDNTIHVTSVTEPIKENVKRYEEYYRIYRSLYQKLKDEFVQVSGLDM
ncbi:xylulokinase [Candidatus Desantisbacteria bacterium CG1_02_38_46]|uniref:Xylulose kinase n=3 Tax=unclassified Candidatus Desantisiibacteriota TaxID=3106372 RepID=A0A2H9PBU9_9BACT|nr:MAG: xylulokinase [Candidatus Desantisbacteria bacterium CG1_02_38_46]PIU51546.1 MAG: xylulokinase [Candidatus Desantisbacteria bacterium CG07_land_8_20_14_0_80_39_15]PIZ16455.1 MAG: xylulokinase [Candidatus Desantisbacteria bacterium CG_4_10_14_0_8_um_filter_39_17]